MHVDRSSTGRGAPSVTRRELVQLAAASVVAPRLTPRRVGRSPGDTFFGDKQHGIVTRPQRHLVFVAYDLSTARRQTLRDLLRAWSTVAATLCSSAYSEDRRTITFGFGASLFRRDGADRFGLAKRCPPSLIELPRFASDDLDPTQCDGDVGVQICTQSPHSAASVVRHLTRAARGVASPRWIHEGFRTGSGGRARNLLGFRDGTHNISSSDPGSLDRYVWVGAEGPHWLRGGTFLVTRHISLDLRAWDALPVSDQEAVIGRRRKSGAPLGGHSQFDPIVLRSLPPTSHVRLAASERSLRILRRSYNYVEEAGASAMPDAGLQFVSFQRSVLRQFVPLQRRLAEHDALNRFARHTGSAVFAIPAGARGPDEFIGQRLLDG